MNIQTVNTQTASYHVLSTTHEGFVTGSCLVPQGVFHVEYANRLLPTMLAKMLMLGTKDKTEDQLNDALESRGMIIQVDSTSSHMVVNFTCLKKDLALLLSLINEILTQPRFDQEALTHLKLRLKTQFEALKDDTGYRASCAFSQIIYPQKHMARQDTADEMIKLLDKVDMKSLKAYHASYEPLMHSKWIMVGDVKVDEVVKMCEEFAPSPSVLLPTKREILISNPQKHAKEIVHINDKQSVDIRMGHSLDIDCHHPDYLPLRLAIDALGGSFSARLMRTVRDEDGLTYNVGSHMGGFVPLHTGDWAVYGSFSPELLDKGVKSIQKQLDLWVKKGVSQQELAERKQGLTGKYAVTLSDAMVVVSRIVSNIESGYDIDYLYTYPDMVNAVSLDHVNKVLKTYIHLDKMSQAFAGSI